MHLQNPESSLTSRRLFLKYFNTSHQKYWNLVLVVFGKISINVLGIFSSGTFSIYLIYILSKIWTEHFTHFIIDKPKQTFILKISKRFVSLYFLATLSLFESSHVFVLNFYQLILSVIYTSQIRTSHEIIWCILLFYIFTARVKSLPHLLMKQFEFII